MCQYANIIKWKQVKEIGVERDDIFVKSELTLPTMVQELCSGDILIYDADFTKNQLIVVSRDGNIIWKYEPYVGNKPIKFGLTRALTPKLFLGIDKEGHRVVEFDIHGKVLWEFRIDQSNFLPVAADRFINGDTVVLDYGNRQVVVVSRQKEIKWVWKPEKDLLLEPCSIQALPCGNLLITDEELHTVFEVTPESRIVWEFGMSGQPGNHDNQLTCPLSAKRLTSGNTLIADSMNNRILEVDHWGNVIWRYENTKDGEMEQNLLFCPAWAERRSNGNTIIADSKNARVIEIGPDGQVLWMFGKTNVKKRLFSYPRSVQILENGNILVADTSNNRVLELNKAGEVSWSYSNSKQKKDSEYLFWPRSAERTAKGTTLIADGRNGRILEVGNCGKLIRKVSEYKCNGNTYKLGDPHYVTELPGGNWLIVDSPKNTVVEIDEKNKAVWLYGPNAKIYPSPLNDPHKACMTLSGDILISDSANNRVLLVNRENNVLREYKEVIYNGLAIPLYWPRYCEVVGKKHFMIIDGKTGWVFIINYKGVVKKCYQAIEKGTLEALKSARYIQLLADDSAVISDNEGSRIIQVSKWV